jgi:hypothetical protein
MLKQFGCGPDIDAVLGDLVEQYRQRGSAMWYWRQALKAIPVSFFREIQSHRWMAARALLLGWGGWIVSLLWFFPFVSPYFFGNGLGVAFSASHPIGSFSSLMWMPVGAPISIQHRGVVGSVLFGIVLPLTVAAICGWLVASFHRQQQRAAVLLFAGSILVVDVLLFGHYVLLVGSRVAYQVLAGPLAGYLAALVLGILLGGGLFRVRSSTVRS